MEWLTATYFILAQACDNAEDRRACLVTQELASVLRCLESESQLGRAVIQAHLV